MSMYDKNHYNIVISLQLIKINEKLEIKNKKNKTFGLSKEGRESSVAPAFATF